MLLDLDGTLTDPYDGISRSIRYAMETVGKPLPSPLDLRWCIGPPMRASFLELCDGERELVEPAVEAYRRRFAAIGIYENRVYPGVTAMLGRLAATLLLVVCTSKPTIYAQRILEHFALREFFAAVYGSELDGTRADKCELIRFVLEREPFAATRLAMLGDREHDMIGALGNGVAAFGALWGYGSPDELTRAQAVRLFRDPVEVTVQALTLSSR